jgi:hypothetical protein
MQKLFKIFIKSGLRIKDSDRAYARPWVHSAAPNKER